jgi:class 3 adenylate cyclase/predicted ATPase
MDSNSGIAGGPAVKRATVMFVDIKGFTALAQEVGPETAYFAVGGAMTLVENVARLHGAAVDRYLGDCLMAVFGHPVPQLEPEHEALAAALEMRRRVQDYGEGLPFKTRLEVVIGVNTGPMVAGEVRGAVVREFHVLGDAVNVSARIKAKAGLGKVLVGGATRAAVAERFDVVPLGSLPLKGKREPVEIFELLRSREPRWRRALGPRGVLETPFLDRDSELASLRESIAGLKQGRGGAFAILGEAGIGKSRLLAAAVGGSEPPTILELGASAHEHAGDRPAFAELAEALDPDARNATLEDGLEAVERQAKAGPLLLAIEDADRLDEASLPALPRLLALAARLPLLVVVLARTPLSASLQRALAPIARLELGPLPSSAARALVSTVAPGAELVSLIEQRGAGNPRQLILAAHLEPALRSEQERQRGDEPKETERRRSTILFADLTGFTALTDQLGAERAYPIVVGCLRMLDEIARKHGGAVEKYLGDCVMALFGVSEAMEDAPRAAVNAAIEMRRRVREYNQTVNSPVALDVHSGINVGVGIAGEVRGSLLREFTVMGDPVDVADALKDLAPSGRIFVGGEVRRFTDEVFAYEPREPLVLKGTREALPVFEVTTEHEHIHRSRVGRERQVISALVGREAELAALRARLRALRDGQGGVISLCAEAGLGKSRLLAELERSPEAEGTRWLLGRSLSTSRRLGFHPFADLLRSFAEISERDDDARARGKLRDALERVMPETAAEALPFIARVLGVALEADERARLDALPGDALEKRVLRHLIEFMRSGSARVPLVVVMDDLHWADQSSLDLLATALPECRERRLLFVNLFRPGYADTAERIRALAAEQLPDLHADIQLAPLDARAARDLLGNLFAAGDLPHATRQLIEVKARGNPFYLEEVVRALVDAGAVEAHAGRFRATERISSFQIPGSIHEVVQARVDGLERDRRRLLQIASVIGPTLRLELLQAVASDEGPIAEGVERLVDAEFLVDSERRPGEEFTFKHPLIQEVTYAGLLETRREELHKRVGSAIESVLSMETPGYHGMLAYHFSKGRALARAEQYLLRAGEDAARAAASNEALHFFEEAAGLYLRIHGDDADPTKRAALEAKIASALYHRGRFIDSVEHYDQALALLGDKLARNEREQLLGFVRDLANVLRRLYLPIRLRRRPASEREREIMALRLARAESTTYALPTRHAFDGMRSVALVQRFDPRSVPASAEMYAGAALLFAFLALSFDVSRRLAAKARELAVGAAPPERLFERVANFTTRALEGDWSAEHEIDPALLDETVRLGHLYWPVTYLGLLAEKRLYQGDFAGAERATAQIDAIWQDYRYDLAKTNHYWLRTLAALEQGRFADARAAATEYYEENPEDLLHLLALGCRAKGEILLGDLDAAERSLAEAAVIAERVKRVPPYHASRFAAARLLLDLTRLEALPAGERASARSLRASLRQSAKAALANAPRMAFTRAEQLRLAGRAEWLLGHRRRALALFERSIRAAEALGATAARARTFAQVGELLRLADERDATFMGRDAGACAAEAERSVGISDGGAARSDFLRA